MIQRLYVNNYRCLQNFDLRLSGQSEVLLIGANGSGKSTVRLALEVLQKIGRGTARVGSLLKPKDFAQGDDKAPIRFAIEVSLSGRHYEYDVAFELPSDFRELRVYEEKFTVDGSPIYDRSLATVHLPKGSTAKGVKFGIDWHQVYLPIAQVQPKPKDNPLLVFTQWLSRMLILRPIPSLMLGQSQGQTLYPGPEVREFGAWFTGLNLVFPKTYGTMLEYLKPVIPDLIEINNEVVGADAYSLSVEFAGDQRTLKLPFEELSDGEKCFMISALVLAANRAYGSLFCFWDEPDNHLSLYEVGHFIVSLRQVFRSGGQLIATSHDPEVIRRFSHENTLFLERRSHLEPTIVRRLDEMKIAGDLVRALIRGDVGDGC